MPASESRRSDRGAAAVEFALVLPILVLVLFGIIEFSLMYNRQQGLHAAAREAARVAALPSSTQSDILDAATGALEGMSFSSSPVVSVSPNTSQPCLNRTGATVTVTVAADSAVDIPLWDNLTVGLTGKGRFRCE